MEYDLLIKNGNVIDFEDSDRSYRPWKKMDIAIKNGKIAEKGNLDPSKAANV